MGCRSTCLAIIVFMSIIAFSSQDNLIPADHKPAPQPRLIPNICNPLFQRGDTFGLECFVKSSESSGFNIDWELDHDGTNVDLKDNANINISTGQDNGTNTVYSRLQVIDASENDQGKYKCIVKSASGQRRAVYEKIFTEEPVLNIINDNNELQTAGSGSRFMLTFHVNSYPSPNFTIWKNGNQIQLQGENKIKITTKQCIDEQGTVPYRLSLTPTTNDEGNYTIVVDNGKLTENFTMQLVVTVNPMIEFINAENPVMAEFNEKVVIYVNAISNNYSPVTCNFNSNQEQVSVYKNINRYSVHWKMEFNAKESGNIVCQIQESRHKKSASIRLLVHELKNELDIANRGSWLYEGQNVTLQCFGAKYLYESVGWSDFELGSISYRSTDLSHVADLEIMDLDLSMNDKRVVCTGYAINGSKYDIEFDFIIEPRRNLSVEEPINETNSYVYPGQKLSFSCVADAVPPPTDIIWYKDGEIITEDDSTKINYIKVDAKLNSTLDMDNVQDGVYKCEIKAETGSDSRSFAVYFKGVLDSGYIIGIVVAFVLLFVCIFYLIWRVRREKKKRKKLAAAGLLNFKEGAKGSLNPDLRIDEQAEFLPYDDRFEFPIQNLKFLCKLGEGAFGVVQKAEAKGILDAEESTIVAVKMVKKDTDDVLVKALASELKIMVHLGKHVNIVNLLGACTQNVNKRELSIIVEYCKFGNIHKYLQQHRSVFIDQFDENTDKEGKVNRAFLHSSAHSGSSSNYFGYNTSQNTDDTHLGSANSNRYSRKASESYVPPDWRSHYEGEYCDRTPRNLFTRDLLSWAYQIACGMEYLASRNVSHGDLAARNILLSENNIVKICDFGLAKMICNDGSYTKKLDGLMPIKWLAIECLTDKHYTTQSDVWAYGVVLWEIFSLAKFPYPGINNRDMLEFLMQGKRLNKPQYANQELYQVMYKCWLVEPMARPTFTELQKTMGMFLDENTRESLQVLNDMYMDINKKLRTGVEDYLAMVSPPTFTNAKPEVFYVNENQPLSAPDIKLPSGEGFLQVAQNPDQVRYTKGNVIDYNAKKNKAREQDATANSELTPMMAISNQGTDSYHQPMDSPQLRAIDESDEVFENGIENIKNILNRSNISISNPTYDKNRYSNEPNQNSYMNVPVTNNRTKRY